MQAWVSQENILHSTQASFSLNEATTKLSHLVKDNMTVPAALIGFSLASESAVNWLICMTSV